MGSRKESLAIWLVPPVVTGLAALWLGQDAGWDLRNYHYYNPYAFLTGRHVHDIMPAYPPTFYNPLLDVPYYLAAQTVPARVIGFCIGALQGLNFPIVYSIARRVLAGGGIDSGWMAALLALLGMFGAGAMLQTGTIFHDSLLAVLANGSLLVVILLGERPRQNAAHYALALCLAALPAGLAAGFKLTMAPYALGLFAAGLAIAPSGRLLASMLGTGAGLGLGFMLAGGYWAYFLWQNYGNPVFPYFNNVFQSPLAAIAPFRDTKFVPDDWIVRLLFPFYFAFDSFRVSEIAFRELRILAAFVATLLALPWIARGAAPSRALIAYGVVAYAAWVMVFCIYRYLSALEILAATIVAAALLVLPWRANAARIATTTIVIVVALLTRYPDFERIAWTERAVIVKNQPVMADPSRSLVLLAGEDPLAYIIPQWPAAPRYLRIDNNFALALDRGFAGIIQSAIQAHQGDIFMLLQSIEVDKAIAFAAPYGVKPAPPCQEIATNLQSYPILFCAVVKASE